MRQFLCELLFSCSLLGAGAPPIDELTYGTVLYEYFQEDHQAALLNALVARKQGRRGENVTRFDLATGSFAFADGMYGYAQETFAAIPEGEIERIDQLRLAFHLAREYHRRQAWQPLSEQLEKIELGETWFGKRRLHPEVEYMRAELAIQRGQFEAAEQHFGAMQDINPLRAYGLFNLGVAYRQSGQLPAAKKTFKQLAQLPAYSDEAFDLSQRAKLALAFIARQTQDTQSAEQVLSALPSGGRYQEVAMAAFGGLAMDNADYELAARIWMTLQQQDYWTPSTATARLGFPLSLERMAGDGRTTTGMALVQFQQAERSFVSRLDNLTRLSMDAQDPQWVQGLLKVFAKDEKDPQQMRVLMGKWEEQLGHTDWLEWLATDKVNQALTQWRELNGMESYLGKLPRKLDALEAVAVEQSHRNEQAQNLLHGDGLLARREQLQQQLSRSAENLADLVTARPERDHSWMFALATPQQRVLLSDLEQMRSHLKYMVERDHQRWRARIDRLQGVIFYQLVDASAARIQALNKEHKALQVLLRDVDVRVVRVQGAQDNFVAGVGTDFAVFVDRAEEIAARVSTARIGREVLLANEIRGRMQREMRQVEQYLLVTRIAIARATDQLAQVNSLASSAGVQQ